jgi:hypothetical protein
MRFKDFKIGTKLMVGFIAVVLVFSFIAGYQISRMQMLGNLQDEGASRFRGSLAIMEISQRAEAFYTIVADAVINRDLVESRKLFAEASAQVEKDLRQVEALVDTNQERAWAKEVAEQYRHYLDLFDRQLLPVLERSGDVEKRFADATAMLKIQNRVEAFYALVADAVINRDLAMARQELQATKARVRDDIAMARDLVDTDAERRLADDFAQQYNHYVSLFEERLLPLLNQGDGADWRKIRDLEAQIDAAKKATQAPLAQIIASLEAESVVAAKDATLIRELDGQIDKARDLTQEPLQKIDSSLEAESEESDKEFDAVRRQTVRPLLSR